MKNNPETFVLLNEFENSNIDIPLFCSAHDICRAAFDPLLFLGYSNSRDFVFTGTAILFAEVNVDKNI